MDSYLESASILHPRRMGNSQLMKYLPTRLHKQQIAPLPLRFFVKDTLVKYCSLQVNYNE